MKNQAPDWEQLLSSLCHLQSLVEKAVVVGGTAVALHAGHRYSVDHDHVIPDLRERFDGLLEQLEEVAGWKTARLARPVMILGSLDGIETGIRQMKRTAPLEIMKMATAAGEIVLPTIAECMRIKASLMLQRNATRDYLDFVACADLLGRDAINGSLMRMDDLYPQKNGEPFAVRTQIVMQLAEPRPFDLDQELLSEYKGVRPPYGDWSYIGSRCIEIACDFADFTASTDPELARRIEIERKAKNGVEP